MNKKIIILMFAFVLFWQISCLKEKVSMYKDVKKVKTQVQVQKSNDDKYVIKTDDELSEEDKDDASWVSLILRDRTSYLFRLRTLRFYEYYVDSYILENFYQYQKVVKSNLIGRRFSYVLYRLGFFNVLVKPYCYELDRCIGFVFYDVNKKRLLILHSRGCTCDYKEENCVKNLKFLESQVCAGIEYFDLKKGIYEFAGFMPKYDIKDGKIVIVKDVFKGIFPGIERDYYFKVELKIDKKLRKIVGDGFGSITPFNLDLYFLDKQNLKEYEGLKKHFKNNEKIKVLETNDMEDEKEFGDWYKELIEKTLNQQNKNTIKK